MNSNLNENKKIKVNSVVTTEEVKIFSNEDEIPKVLPNSYTGNFISKFLNEHKKLAKILKIIILILIVEIMFITYYFGMNKRIFSGVSIEGIDLSGKTRSEACEILKDKLESKVVNQELTIFYGNYSKLISLSDIINSLDYAKIARDAQRVGRDGSLFERFGAAIHSKIYGTEVSLKYSIDMVKLRSVIYSAKYDIDKDAINSSYVKNHGSDFVINKETIGLALDVAKTIDRIREIVENNAFDDYDCKIEMVVDKIIPEKTEEIYLSYSCELSYYQTEYRRSDIERMDKLSLQASKLDTYLIEPDAVFSFNEVMGETITKEASEEGSDNNDEVNVQIATTLYNAAILAGLEIVERTNCDSLPDYIDIGRDALVYGKQVDLKFKNTTTNPIYIECYTNNGKLVVRLYGSQNFKIYDSVNFDRKITTAVPSNEVIETYDRQVLPGERVVTQIGKSGCTAKLKVIYKVLGQKDREVNLPDSVYLPTPTRVSVGDISMIKNKDKDDDKNKEIEVNKINNTDVSLPASSGTITIGEEVEETSEENKDDENDTKRDQR